MTEVDVDRLVEAAEGIYAARLQEVLEPKHVGEFVAIEPQSGDYFLGKTLSEASQAAQRVHPDRLTHVMRIGQAAAICL